MKSKTWRRCWNEEGWTEAPCSFRIMQNASELFVHERMSQGKRVKGIKEKKKVPGWSIVEMKKNGVSQWRKILTEEVGKWRGLQSWKNFG